MSPAFVSTVVAPSAPSRLLDPVIGRPAQPLSRNVVMPVVDRPAVDPLADLLAEALAHPAVDHPWLAAQASASPRALRGVIRDFAVSYQGYSAWFPRYLRAVIDTLTDPAQRQLLLHNLAEEQGQLGADDRDALAAIGIDPDSVDGVPHPELFRRFCRALGVRRDELAIVDPAVAAWREEFLAALQSHGAAFGVGALGLGTESIVRPIYEQLLDGIRRIDGLERADYVFFELHCEVDDQHQKDLLEIARALASTPEGHAELARGMRTALELRTRYWDVLEERRQRARA